SLTPHVSVSANCSATSTAFLSVFHQHLIGSELSFFSAAGPGACACAGAAASNTPNDRTIAAARRLTRQRLSLMNSLLHLSQSPLGDEFNQNRFHFPAIEPHADDVEIGVAREPHHFLLPLVNAICEPR